MTLPKEQSKDPDQKRVRELSPGMKLARDVHSDDGSQLFQSGDTLSSSDIEKLENWNIRLVYVQPQPEE